jgi:hypothetical protein
MSDHLAGRGWSGAEPLRWAITAVDPGRGLRLEGVALVALDTAASRERDHNSQAETSAALGARPPAGGGAEPEGLRAQQPVAQQEVLLAGPEAAAAAEPQGAAPAGGPPASAPPPWQP